MGEYAINQNKKCLGIIGGSGPEAGKEGMMILIISVILWIRISFSSANTNI